MNTIQNNQWITQEGEEIAISDMDTAHLYYSVRMLWNHYCPPDLQLRPFKLYLLHFSREYVVSRLRSMVEELSRRGDLTERQLSDLNFMCRSCCEVDFRQELLR